MPKKLTILMFVLAVLGMQACYSPQQLLDKGKYAKAIEKSMKQYPKSSKKQALITTAQQSYESAHKMGLQSINVAHNSNSDLKYEQALEVYKGLQSLYDKIARNTAFCDVIHPINYNTEIAQYTDMATNVRYDRAQSLMNGTSKVDFQSAFFEFQKALKLTPNAAQIQQGMKAAYDMGVTNVMIDYLHFKEPVSRSDRDQIQHTLLEQLMLYLDQNEKRQFLQFYTLSEIYDKGLRTDQSILLSIDRFNITKYRDKVERRKVSKSIFTPQIKNGKEVNVETIIHAELTITTKSIKPQMRLLLAILNEQNTAIWTDLIDEEVEWEVTWATFTGDKKALSDADLKLLGDPPSRIPNDAYFIDELMKKVQPQVQQSLHSIYSRWGF